MGASFVSKHYKKSVKCKSTSEVKFAGDRIGARRSASLVITKCCWKAFLNANKKGSLNVVSSYKSLIGE